VFYTYRIQSQFRAHLKRMGKSHGGDNLQETTINTYMYGRTILTADAGRASV
jgi:hypothetical protein